MNKDGMLRNDALKDKVIVVTGGGTGLGRAMSSYFSTLGAKVVIASRNMEVLEKTADEISRLTNNPVLPLSCDVRSYEEVVKIHESVISTLGKVDGLVNNAAGNFISPTERLSNRAFDAVVGIVLKGSYNTSLAFGKHWIAKNQVATILNIVTTYAWTGSGWVVPSACAKAGVLSLTRSLAVEWGPKGIRSNAIAPGPFPTKGAWDRLVPGNLKQKFDMTKRVPLRRVGEHQELANLAAYLMSDFSAYINGEVVTIDGGEWLQGAGQFNMMEHIPENLWDMISDMTKKAKS